MSLLRIIFVNSISLIILYCSLNYSGRCCAGEPRVARAWSDWFWNPFAPKPDPTSIIPLPIPNILKPEVPDYCKDPLKFVIKSLVEMSASRFLSLVEPSFVPQFTKDMEARAAGDMAEQIIQIYLTEGNMARAIARVIAMDFKIIPYFGGSLAAIVEPQVETAAKTSLDGLCATLNCCFD